MEQLPAKTSELSGGEFSEFIGENDDMWSEYRKIYGPEAYKYRRLYEAMCKNILTITQVAEENGWELPGPGPGTN